MDTLKGLSRILFTTQAVVHHLPLFNSTTAITTEKPTNISSLVRVCMSVNIFTADLKLDLPPETFYQSTKSQKVLPFATSKNIPVMVVNSLKLQEPLLPLLAKLKMD